MSDDERLLLVRCYGIPVHAWSVEFFVHLTTLFEVYVNADEITRNQKSMDVARLIVRNWGQEATIGWLRRILTVLLLQSRLLGIGLVQCNGRFLRLMTTWKQSQKVH